MSDVENNLGPRDGAENEQKTAGETVETRTSQASISRTISTLRLKSRGFLDCDRFIDAVEMEEPQSSQDRDANVLRVASKLGRGFLDGDRFIDAMGMDVPHSFQDRDENLGRVASKLGRAMVALRQYRKS